LSVFAVAVVLSLLPRRYGYVVAVAVACAVVGFAATFLLAEAFPRLSGVALAVGTGSSGAAVLVTVEGLDVALSFVPAEFDDLVS